MYARRECYHRITRIALTMVGLWPYQESVYVLIQKVSFTIILVTFAIVQLLVFVTTEYSLELFLRVFSMMLPTIFIMIKYSLFIIEADNVKHLLNQIHADCNLFRNKLEIDIIKKYSRSAWLFSISAFSFGIFGISFGIILQYLPVILDVVSPLNVSRPLRLFIITEYFVNEEKYFYILVIHEILSCSVIGMTLICTGVTLVIFMTHVCVMFGIARYRMESIIEDDLLSIPISKRKELFYTRIVSAVIVHQKAIEFLEYLMTIFMKSFGILIVVGVGSLIFNLFYLIQLVTLRNNIRDAIIFIFLVTGQLVYMFILNYGGQQITDHGVELFQAIYNTLWYAAPLHTQKLLIFIMQKCVKNVTMTCCGLYVASLEGFASLLSTVISYFMVIYSSR